MKNVTMQPTLPMPTLTGKAMATKIKDMNLPLDIEETYLSAVADRPSISEKEMRTLVDKMASSQGDSDTAAAFELNLRGVFPQPPAAAPVDVKTLSQNIQEKMGEDPFEIGGQFIAGLRNFKSDQVSHGQIQQVLGDVRENASGPWPGGADIAEGAAWETESLELALGKFLKAQVA